MTQAQAGTLVAHLCEWLDRLFPDAPRRDALTEALDAAFAGDHRPVTAEVCREIEGVAHRYSRHVELEFHAGGELVRDDEPPGWPPQDPSDVRRRAASVGSVRRERDGIGVLALDGLDSAPLAAPYVERAAERALPAATSVAVLVSERTYSSGEALAYHVQARSRATLIGQATPGAADHVTPIRVTEHVRALLPEAVVRDAVTGGNWEGTGVVPDVACAPGEELEIALGRLRGG